MTKYNKIWVPAGSPVPVDARGINGFQYRPVKDAIVMTESELLDLMQESIEHSYAQNTSSDTYTCLKINHPNNYKL